VSARYFLRTTDAQGRAYGGFQWPLEVGAVVTAPDWRDDANCGGGLHGLLNGEGDSSHLSWSDDALWWVVAVEDGVPCVDLTGKHKFQSCRVVAFGDRKTATDALLAVQPGAAVHGCFKTGGDRATVTGGYRATVTGGDRATVTGGNRATVTGGDDATVTGGYRATVTGGNRATVTGGYDATVTGGDDATVTGGNWATVTGGNWATVTGGNRASLSLKWWDGNRYRIAVAYVGEDGIEPGAAYRCKGGKFVEAAK
jgi:hypothetical protein